jgi:hypothetical protein
MKALTLWPEWAFAIQRFGKDGENRTWPLWESMIGVPFAIHAGMLGVHAEPRSKRGLQLRAFHDSMKALGIETTATRAESIRGHIVAVVTCGFPTQHPRSRWGANDGQWFWPFTSVRVLETPIACKGAQGLWDVPSEIERLIHAP